MIKKILTEWSYRLDDGIINLNNPKHMLILSEVLKDMKLPTKVILEVMSNLTEKKKSTPLSQKDKDKMKKMGLIWKGKGYGKEGEKGILYKNVDGKLVKSGDSKKQKIDPKVNVFTKQKTDKPTDTSTKTDKPTDAETNTKPVNRSKFKTKTSQPLDSKKKPKSRYEGASKADYPTQQEMLDDLNNGNFDKIKQNEEQIGIDRNSGNAGAGGPVASKGEKMVNDVVKNHNDDEFAKQNRKEIDERKKEIEKRKKSADEKRLAKDLGLDPNSSEFNEYLAKRETFANKECEKMRKLPKKKNVYYGTGKNGFGGDEKDGSCSKAFLEWAGVAYDGGLEIQQATKDHPDFDETQEQVPVQSTTETDDAVQAHLEDKYEEHKKKCGQGTDESCKKAEHYKKQLNFFKDNRKYHDTYIMGKTKDGETIIISVSNKKGSNMKDPQNNTTPRKRFQIIKDAFGENVSKEVIDTMDRSIDKVSKVQQVTREESGKLENPSDLKEHSETAISSKRRKDICNKGKKKVGRGSSFGRWLEKNKPGVDFDKMCSGENDGELLKVMGEYNADNDWHEENGDPPYDPFSKVFIKVGESVKQKNLTLWKRENPDKNADDYVTERKRELEQKENLTDEERCELMKLREQEAVNEAHADVINSINEADSGNSDTRPDNPDGENGPHAQAYIRTVMDALHFNKYINMDDEAAQSMIVQMGIHGAKPNDIRDCLAELSGFEGDTSTPEGRKALQEHIEKNAKLDQSKTPPAIIITGPKGREQSLMEDTWRTAGTSQKVASGLGEGMRECLTEKTNNRRQGK